MHSGFAALLEILRLKNAKDNTSVGAVAVEFSFLTDLYMAANLLSQLANCAGDVTVLERLSVPFSEAFIHC